MFLIARYSAPFRSARAPQRPRAYRRIDRLEQVTKPADHIPTGLAGVTGLILYRFSHMAVQPDLPGGRGGRRLSILIGSRPDSSDLMQLNPTILRPRTTSHP